MVGVAPYLYHPRKRVFVEEPAIKERGKLIVVCNGNEYFHRVVGAARKQKIIKDGLGEKCVLPSIHDGLMLFGWKFPPRAQSLVFVPYFSADAYQTYLLELETLVKCFKVDNSKPYSTKWMDVRSIPNIADVVVVDIGSRNLGRIFVSEGYEIQRLQGYSSKNTLESSLTLESKACQFLYT